MSEWIDVSNINDFKSGSKKVIDIDGTMVIVVNIAGNYFAIEDICTHDGGDLSGGRIEADTIICPRHGAKFCLKTGEALTPPAFEAVSTFPTRIVEHKLQVRDARWD